MDEVRSFGCVIIGIGLVFLIIFGLVQIPKLITDIHDSRTAQLQAQVELERAESMREHQQSIDWQREFQLYSITLAAYLDGNMLLVCFLSGILGALGAVLFTSWLGKAKVL